MKTNLSILRCAVANHDSDAPATVVRRRGQFCRLLYRRITPSSPPDMASRYSVTALLCALPGVIIGLLHSFVIRPDQTMRGPAPKVAMWVADISVPDVDIGSISPQGETSAELVVFNRGNEALHIDRIVPNCGCFIPRLDTTLIPQRGHLKVPIIINGQSLSPGAFSRRATVIVSDLTNTHQIDANVSGTIDTKRSITIYPPALTFTDRTALQTVLVRADTAIVSQLPTTIELSDSEDISIPISAPTLAGRTGEAEIEVKYLGTADHFQKSLVFTFSGVVNYSASVPMRRIAARPITLSPSVVLLSPSSDEPHCSATLEIHHECQQPIRFIAASSFLPLVVKLVGQSPGVMTLQISADRDALALDQQERASRISIQLEGVRDPLLVPVLVGAMMTPVASAQ